MHLNVVLLLPILNFPKILLRLLGVHLNFLDW